MMNVPQHISIIMDGNGRWAQSRGLERSAGHVAGVESVRRTINACLDLGVRYLSLYTFSEENWNRPAEEVQALMKLLMKSISDEFSLILEKGVRFVALGHRERLGAAVNEALRELERATESNTALTMVIMLSYSGKWDIEQAFNRLLAEGRTSVTQDDIASALVTSGIPDPELVIRTSGEKRISNYMLWQTAYSEFVFSDTLWPDFGKEDLVAAIGEYSSRDRRFGKVK